MQNVLEFDMHIYTQYLLLTHLHPKVNITNTFTSKGEHRCYFQLRVNSLVPDYHISSPVKYVCSSIVQGGDVLSVGIVEQSHRVRFGSRS